MAGNFKHCELPECAPSSISEGGGASKPGPGRGHANPCVVFLAWSWLAEIRIWPAPRPPGRHGRAVVGMPAIAVPDPDKPAMESKGLATPRRRGCSHRAQAKPMPRAN